MKKETSHVHVLKGWGKGVAGVWIWDIIKPELNKTVITQN
jgi:hypothetical protein